jgi:hypothetical protein
MANKKKDSGPPPSPTTIEDTLAEELDQVWRMLKEAAEQQKMGMEAVKPMRLLLIRVFGQLLRLQEKIDAAYGGQPFDYRYAPMSPMNLWRAESFIAAHHRVHRWLFRAMTLWCLSAGMRWSCGNTRCASARRHGRGRRRTRRRPNVQTAQ